jgi:DNA polymerase III epsilon subunit-like protein
MTRYLFFDTSAAGKPIKWDLPYTDTFNWPRMIHLAWILMDDQKHMLEEAQFIVKPNGFEISEEDSLRHKVTQEDAIEQGVPVKDALLPFKEVVAQADMIFTHNQQFNENVVSAEFLRAGIENPLPYAEINCLMRESTYFCKLPGKGGGYKWPSLQELYGALFGKKYKYANNAYIDVKVTAACFFALRDRGALEDLL